MYSYSKNDLFKEFIIVFDNNLMKIDLFSICQR
jgi:hypothetical protein